MLPDFIIIGSHKSGTTSLHYYLKQHPEIGMSSLKETDFFLRDDYMDAVPEYEAYFNGGRVRGESSPCYSWWPHVPDIPRRIHSLLPDAKLIYLVRDPVERAIALYWERYASWHAEPIDQAFAEPDNPYVCGSLYATQVDQYLRFFPWESLHIVDSHDLRHNRRETLGGIFRFLGVGDHWSSVFDEEWNTIEKKRRPTAFGARLRHSRPANIVRRFPSPVRKALFRTAIQATSTKVVRTPLSEAARTRVERTLRPDIERFRQMTGRDFARWSV